MTIFSFRNVLVLMVLAVVGGCARGPGIEGTYRLVRRELPDGRVQQPPQVLGHHSYTRTHRHTTVAWKDAAGQWYSQSYVAVYRLSPDRYVEAPVYLAVSDPAGGSGPVNKVGGDAVQSPVTTADGTVRFEAPAPFERALNIEFEYDNGGFRATGRGLFVDYWVKTD